MNILLHMTLDHLQHSLLAQFALLFDLLLTFAQLFDLYEPFLLLFDVLLIFITVVTMVTRCHHFLIVEKLVRLDGPIDSFSPSVRLGLGRGLENVQGSGSGGRHM